MPARKTIPKARTRVDDLSAARERLFASLAVADVRELPGIVRELRAVLAELDELAPPEKGNAVDDLAARRAARRQSASDAAGATAGGKQRR